MAKPLAQSIDPQPHPLSIYSAYLKSQAVNYRYSSKKKSDNVTIYGLVSVHNYLVGCSSNGMICIWNNMEGRKHDDIKVNRKRSIDEVDGCRPTLCIRAAKENHSFYDIQFIPDKELLIVYGDPGILLYKWSDIQRALQSSQSDIQPIATFHPHPSPCREAIEINSTSYDAQNNVLYAASGDGFGCYQWDLETERLLGTFGRSNRGEHVDYLHTVRVVGEHVITGGEDGKMGFWSGKERKLIQIYDIRNTMDENTQLVAGQKSNRGFLNNSSVWNNGSNLWISSIELNSNWLAVAGGAEQGQHNGITARSSSTHSISGFMTMWHLPTRSFSSGCLTRESIHSMVYNPSLDLFVTGGNEGRISYWECTSAKRVGRAWCSSSATYALTVLPENGRMFAGGSGGVVDCFVDRVRIAELRV